MDNAHAKTSILINQAAYDELRHYFAPSKQGPRHVLAMQPMSVSQQIDQTLGRRHIPSDSVSDEITSWQVASLLGQHRILQSAIQYDFGDGPGNAAHKGEKRALPSDVDAPVVVSKRKARTCIRCHRADCEGRFKSKPCTIREEVRT